MWCNDAEFWEWLGVDGEMGAAAYIYSMCFIKSRAELDHSVEAAEKFHRLIRGPYSKYMQARGFA